MNERLIFEGMEIGEEEEMGFLERSGWRSGKIVNLKGLLLYCAIPSFS